jgi:hypothetical protein
VKRRSALLAGIGGGVAATLVMDAAMVLAAELAPDAFASDKTDPGMIGRWAAGLARGRWRHEDISTEPPVRGELCIGLAAHYATGILLTGAYLATARRRGRRPGVVSGTAWGVVTSVLPLLVMFPSMGYGACGQQSADARRIVGAMLVGHLAFGAGIGAWVAASNRWG